MNQENNIVSWSKINIDEKMERLENILEDIVIQQARITYHLAPMLFDNQKDCINQFEKSFKRKLGKDEQ